jgi:hypothetical protein
MGKRGGEGESLTSMSSVLLSGKPPGGGLGYAGTLTHIYYLDLTANRVKLDFSTKFGGIGVGLGPPTPDTLQLCATLDGKYFPAADQEVRSPIELGLVAKNIPLFELNHFDLQVCSDDPTFGMRVDVCSLRGCIYLSSMAAHSTGARLSGWRHSYVGSYIVEINKYAIFTADHFHNTCAATRDKVSASSSPTFVLTLARNTSDP